MSRYRKRPVVIEATQWFRHGDHAAVVHPVSDELVSKGFGWVPTLEGGHVVTPGDWIITGVHGERYPCKPDIFAKTYESVDDPDPLPADLALAEIGREGK